MKYIGYILVLIWLFMIFFPKIVAYILGWLLLFIWLNIIIFNYKIVNFFKNIKLSNSKNDKDWDFFKIGSYKIYK